ncbi:hypothetical protein DUNSADRAFT_4751 [Dunaliella salina]|uniref:G-patch domain-containing protein n=1 Tax=Dunaliella salina TaxID=3046 RepID=A0ABQ7GRF6_DUNSA|nr:hypothetical protein DUNSADRAFT_4751 [Dunaliella salina]|eukprot:KAF5837191.1 hypothetical protein DUNSADRAFT_4751 [Dunaliella salina]
MHSDSPAQFYRELVNLDDSVPQWGPIVTRGTSHPPPVSHRGSKAPPAFRSAGVVDLSDPNDVGRRSSGPTAPAPPTPAGAASGAPAAPGTGAASANTQSPQLEELTGASLQGCQQHVLWPDPTARNRTGLPSVASSAANSQGVHAHGYGRSHEGSGADDLGTYQGREGFRGSGSRGAVGGLHPGSHHLTLDPGGGGGGGPGVVVLGPRQARRAAADRRLASGEAQLAAQLSAARHRSASDRAASDRAHPQPAVQLPPDSVGYRLLRAAGWRPGAGLGSIVDRELAGESMEAKLARHRAAEEAAADAAHTRALQRALFAAFNDPLDNAGAATANTNPLSRPNRLTATNPLLGSDSD